ncbi:TRAP transporter small permease [Faunimonas sp. B44]|uniref:TRAP transporter small permease n=1 Tax=Faunimonas sp. B44 TaxID=3461493 RepID=UPI004043CFA6
MRAGSGAEPSAPPPRRRRPLERGVEALAFAAALVGGLVLVAVAFMVSASVLGRWLFGRAIDGDFEMVQVGAAIAAFLFLPLCQLHGQNIVVDAFTARASRRAVALIDAFWALVYAAVAAFLAWRLAIGAFETIRSGMTTPMVQLPYGWAMVAGAAALGFLALASALVAIRRARDPRR